VFILAVRGRVADTRLDARVVDYCLVNCLYYASIGAVYVDMRKPRGRVAKIKEREP